MTVPSGVDSPTHTPTYTQLRHLLLRHLALLVHQTSSTQFAIVHLITPPANTAQPDGSAIPLEIDQLVNHS